jgi:sporulation protein YlmC with PRC-barrel domain
MIAQAQSSLRFNNDVFGKEVVDSIGFNSGRVRDIALNVDTKAIEGLVVGKRFIPWSFVADFGRQVILNRRWFSISSYESLPSGNILLSHGIVNERLLDHHGKPLGRICDASVEKEGSSLRISHIFADSFNQQKLSIPWDLVSAIKATKPTAIILRYSMHQISDMAKEMILA